MQISLRNKIMILVTAMAVTSGAIVGYFSYQRTVEVTTNKVVDGLMGEARLIALQFQNTFDKMRSDASVILKTPPITGLIRSLRHKDVDQADGSTTQQWRNRLETIFISLMDDRPYYTQIRYVGLAHHGRELVRVNRIPQGYERVPEEQLQEKEGEPYFKNALQFRNGEPYFSNVTYNREHGKVASVLVPTLRMLLPVYQQDHLFGFIIINADYEALLEDAFQLVSTKREAYLVNDQGDYMHWGRKQQDTGLTMATHTTKRLPELINNVFQKESPETHAKGDDYIACITRVPMSHNKNNNKATFTMILSDNKFDLLNEAYETRSHAAMVIIILITVAVFMAAIVSHWFTRPLNQMTERILTSTPASKDLDLPTHQKDEIGALARAFKRLAHNLKENEMEANSILEHAIDGIITIDESGKIKKFNPAAEQIFGYMAWEVLGRNINMLMPPSYACQHDIFLQRYIQTGEKKIIGSARIVEGKRKDGQVFPMDLSISEVTYSAYRLFTGVIRDISEMEKIRKFREQLIKELKQSNDDLDHFAYIASHDLKEPLRAIYNHARFLTEDFRDVLGEEGNARTERLTVLSKRMEQLIDDLLYYSRLGRQEMAMKETDVNIIIEDLQMVMADTLAEKNGVIEINGTLPCVTCDAVRITEVFRNLIANALKYNTRNEKKIEIGVCDHNGQTAFYVKDNGIGIDAEFHTEVFNIFRRLNSEKKFGPGTGVGLTYVEKIVRRHGGRIWIESEKEKGATFYFTLMQNSDQLIIETT